MMAGPAAAALPYVFAITAGAFLLFQVQPLAGKVILPWFGGSTSVWSTCLVFFQAVLFGGYLYAHLLRTRLSERRQALVHGLLVTASLAFLPLGPDGRWVPPPQTSPVMHIMTFLTVTLGLPFFLLCSASPLLQAWFSHRPGRRPYRLYAFSNAGSLLGLLAYPFVLEPLFALPAQQRGWSAGYAAWAAVVAAIAFSVYRQGDVPGGERRHGPSPAGAPSPYRRTMVFGFALCGSLLMAAATHSLCEDIAVVPLLWVLPLSLYLVTFILAFGWEGSYRRYLMLSLLALTTAAAVAALFLGLRLPPVLRIAALSAFLFFACMVCHGEMVRLKPGHRRLTDFYLTLSAGGAAGTSLVVFAAPLLFDGYWELHTGIVLCWTLAALAVLVGRRDEPLRGGGIARAAAAVAILLLVVVLRVHTVLELAGTVRAERNFYGSLKIVEADTGGPGHRLELINGGVLHGSQFIDPRRRRLPSAYYGTHSGLGFAFQAARQGEGEERGIRVGGVGLGIGVSAAHGKEKDSFRFYEINPAVVRAAREDFSYLEDSPAQVSIVQGDGRLVMERELKEGHAGLYDLLVIDAFTGDAIPVHLLTRESLQIYLGHLAPGGKLAFNISNRYLDLRPLMRGLADDAGLEVLIVDTLGEEEKGTRGATWALMAREERLFSGMEKVAAHHSRPLPLGRDVLWTDGYSNIFRLLL